MPETWDFNLQEVPQTLSSENVKALIQSSLYNYSDIIRVGQNNQTITIDPQKGLYIGSGNFSDAPFSVSFNGALRATSATISGVVLQTTGVFGGNGSDGALSITSGTTTIDLGGVAVFTKQYTSISITGTGKLAFSNPASTGTIIILKSQGDVTLTSSTVPCIDASGMGGAGGAGGVGTTGFQGAPQNGAVGTQGINIQDDLTTHPGNGASNNGNDGGTGGVIYSNLFLYPRNDYQLVNKRLVLACGSGGGGGGGAASTPVSNGGDGGRGGGALSIECAGYLNFTGTVSVAGAVGNAGVDVANTDKNLAGGGGGGGGAGGMCYVLYNNLTANSGTINSNGGVGGKGGDCTDSAGSSGGNNGMSGAGGGGGGSIGGAGGAGAAGGVNTTNNGTAGSAGAGLRAGGGGGSGACVVHNASTTRTGGAGGAGGGSESTLVAKNYIFA